MPHTPSLDLPSADFRAAFSSGDGLVATSHGAGRTTWVSDVVEARYGRPWGPPRRRPSTFYFDLNVLAAAFGDSPRDFFRGSYARTTRLAYTTNYDLDIVVALGGQEQPLTRKSIASLIRFLKRGSSAEVETSAWSSPSRAWYWELQYFLTHLGDDASEAFLDTLMLLRQTWRRVRQLSVGARSLLPLRVATTEVASVISSHGPPSPALVNYRPHAAVSAFR